MKTFETIIEKLPNNMKKKLEQLKCMRERPDFHPEDNVFIHIKTVTERCIEFGDPDMIMAGIFHDIHKLDTMKINPKTGWPTSPGHDKWARKTIENDEGVRAFISDFSANPDTVAGICGQHMRIHQIGKMREFKRKQFLEFPFFPKLVAFGVLDDMLVDDATVIKNAKSKFKIAVESQMNNELNPEITGKYSKDRNEKKK